MMILSNCAGGGGEVESRELLRLHTTVRIVNSFVQIVSHLSHLLVCLHYNVTTTYKSNTFSEWLEISRFSRKWIIMEYWSAILQQWTYHIISICWASNSYRIHVFSPLQSTMIDSMIERACCTIHQYNSQYHVFRESELQWNIDQLFCNN